MCKCDECKNFDAINRNVDAERVLLEGHTNIKPINFKTVTMSTEDAEFLESKSFDTNWIKDRFETDKQHTNFVDIEVSRFLERDHVSSSVSKRGLDWLEFSAKVLDHIENYTIPQYDDKGKDQITNWTKDECLNQVTRYAFRQGKNIRENQDELDHFKMAHYVQLSHNKLKGDI